MSCYFQIIYKQHIYGYLTEDIHVQSPITLPSPLTSRWGGYWQHIHGIQRGDAWICASPPSAHPRCEEGTGHKRGFSSSMAAILLRAHTAQSERWWEWDSVCMNRQNSVYGPFSSKKCGITWVSDPLWQRNTNLGFLNSQIKVEKKTEMWKWEIKWTEILP